MLAGAEGGGGLNGPFETENELPKKDPDPPVPQTDVHHSAPHENITAKFEPSQQK